MEREKRHVLRLFDAIEQDGQASQRDLSKRLGLSLGLTNHLIRRSIRDGYFEVHVLPPKHSTYVLTPEGRDAKSRLAREYLGYSLGFYRDVRKTIQKKLGELEKEQIRDIILYGVGDIAELIYLCLQGSSIKVVGVVDKKDEGGIFFGHQIYSLENLSILPPAPILVTSLDECGERSREIMERAGLNREVLTMEFSLPITNNE
jgi:DNA-binding MarR family transcriptional regulator